MADELTSQIETNAKAPKSAMVDGRSATQHDLKDLIEAQKFLDTQAVMKKPAKLVFNRIVPPGSV